MKVSQVAQLRGKSKSFFYRYFTSLEGLTASAGRNQTNRVVAAIFNQSDGQYVSDDVA